MIERHQILNKTKIIKYKTIPNELLVEIIRITTDERKGKKYLRSLFKI